MIQYTGNGNELGTGSRRDSHAKVHYSMVNKTETPKRHMLDHLTIPQGASLLRLPCPSRQLQLLVLLGLH